MPGASWTRATLCRGHSLGGCACSEGTGARGQGPSSAGALNLWASPNSRRSRVGGKQSNSEGWLGTGEPRAGAGTPPSPQVPSEL